MKMYARQLRLVLPLMLCLVQAFGCSPGPDGSEGGGTPTTAKNVVVVMIDTLRADHLGLYGYPADTSPFLDSLASQVLVFEHAYSHYSYTWPTISNFFTGKPFSELVAEKGFVSPKAPDQPGLVDSNATLAERLATAGVRTFGVSANPYVNGATGFGQGFERFHDVLQWDPDFWQKVPKFPAERVNEVAREYIEELSEANDPWLLYVHYFDPHMPYQAPDRDRSLFVESKPIQEGRFDGYVRGPDGEPLSFLTPDVEDWLSPGDIDRVRAEYDAEIHHVDRNVRDLMKFLKDSGVEDEVTVIVTADHGEAFYERGFWGHGFLSRAEEERVPLLVAHPPSQRVQARISHPVTTTDVFHSILHHFGVSPTSEEGLMPWQVDVFTGQRLGREIAYTEGLGDARIFRTPRYSLYRYLKLEGAQKIPASFDVRNGDFLFDLARDPDETQNLLETDPELANRIRQNLLKRAGSLGEDLQAIGPDPMEEADEETRRRLRSLGYLQ